MDGAIQPLIATGYSRTLNGSTQAHLMHASDGNLYAVKFQNNPHNARSLASEFLATRLGLWLGLPMLPVELIHVPEALVNRGLLRIEDDGNRLTRCASGRQLAIRYLPDAIADMPTKLTAINREDLVRALPFDKWTGNCDHRQVLFVPDGKQYRIVFIDQHQCFDRDRWLFHDSLHYGLYKDHSIYRGLKGLHSFEPILSRIQNIIPLDLWKLAAEVPPEWYDHDSQALSRLIQQLYRRRAAVPKSITSVLAFGDSGKPE
jgi:hypothetical protein